MATLEIRLLGDFQLLRDGEAVPLPASKKTRALLAYLVVTGQPQRRDRLCELFWELPDDPRGALRWSLSKLRPLVNEEGIERLHADRERVSFRPTDVETDLGRIEKQFSRQKLSARSLAKGLKALEEPYLGGIDLPELSAFDNWLAVERERINRFRSYHAPLLIDHEDTPPDAGLAYARHWADLAPFNTDAANAVIRSLMRLGHKREAERVRGTYRDTFAEAGVAWSPPSLTVAPAPAATEKEREPDDEPASVTPPSKAHGAGQKVQFCKTADGVSIAYASVGSGPPLVKAANWMTHLELDWDAPIWSPLFQELARDHTFIRYDERGCGLSDWNVPDITLDTFVADLETVVDTMKLKRFPLIGISQGAAVSIAYSVRHPERVSKLILFGGYPAGWRIDASPEELAEREALMTLTQSGWGQDNPAYRHIFSATFMPGATAEQLNWFDDFQRQTTCAENAVRFLSAFGDIDVRPLLSEVKVPTLVLHSRGDRRIPWEVGRDLAAAIPTASLVTLDSDNHLLLEDEPAAGHFLRAVRDFLSEPGR